MKKIYLIGLLCSLFNNGLSLSTINVPLKKQSTLNTSFPAGFSWVDDKKVLSFSKTPFKKDHIKALKDHNIRTIITLNEFPLDKYLVDENILYVHLPVEDFEAPTHKQIITALEIIEKTSKKGYATHIHCRSGIGRTGTLIACWLIKTKNISALEALSQANILHPSLIEIEKQEAAVKLFEQHHKNNKKT